MILRMHPTRAEALTFDGVAMKRWSLDTRDPAVLAQLAIAGERVGEISWTTDGEVFAVERRRDEPGRAECVVDLRRWETLDVLDTLTIPRSGGSVTGLSLSPDGRWLVVADLFEHIHLIDRHTRHLSHRAYSSEYTSGIQFDPTSTYVAGVGTFQGGGYLRVWRVDAIEPSNPPKPYEGNMQEYIDEEIAGTHVLAKMHEDLAGDIDLADTFGAAQFTPDSRVVLFAWYEMTAHGYTNLMACDVASGRRLWYNEPDAVLTATPALTPDGTHFVAPTQENELHYFSLSNGTLARRQQIDVAVRSLLFNHIDGHLWLTSDVSPAPLVVV